MTRCQIQSKFSRGSECSSHRGEGWVLNPPPATRHPFTSPRPRNHPAHRTPLSEQPVDVAKWHIAGRWPRRHWTCLYVRVTVTCSSRLPAVGEPLVINILSDSESLRVYLLLLNHTLNLQSYFCLFNFLSQKKKNNVFF